MGLKDLLALLIAASIGSGVGYYFAPGKVKIVEKVQIKNNIKTVEVIKKDPAGNETKTVTTVDLSQSESAKQTEKNRAQRDWLVGGGSSWQLNGKQTIMVSVQRRIIGELYFGVYGSSDKSAGLGLSFRF